MKITRAEFNGRLAPGYARGEIVSGPSARFVWSRDDAGVTVVAGPAEKRFCDLALAYGLTIAEGDWLRIVLPEAEAAATLHRLAYLSPRDRVTVETYARAGQPTEARRISTRPQALEAYLSIPTAAQARKKGGLEAAFSEATVPLHLGDRTDWVRRLVDAIAFREELDPAHLKGERSWHCRGQKVLRLTRAKAGVRVEAGIMRDGLRYSVVLQDPISDDELAQALTYVDDGIRRRLTSGSEFHRPDEHWLQAVLRRNAHLVGLESRVLREVPAWRRSGAMSLTPRNLAWGLGYIDLLGVDPHGAVQIIETKLAANSDPMFILQGLDYLMFCEAYRIPITRRLDVKPTAPFAIKFVLGAPKGSQLKMSRFAPAQLAALPGDVTHEVLTLTKWWHAPCRPAEARVELATPDKVAGLVPKSTKSSGMSTGGGGWSRAEIDRAVQELVPGPARSLVERLLAHADAHAVSFKGGGGAAPSAGFSYEVAGQNRSVWSLYVKQQGPVIRINLDAIAKSSPDRAINVADVLRGSPVLAAELGPPGAPSKRTPELVLISVLAADGAVDRIVLAALDVASGVLPAPAGA
jgi:hypothetical protein